MGTILGIIGFVMGMTSIWFTTEAIRRVDKSGEGLIRPHLRGLKAKIGETNDRISRLETRLENMEARMLSLFMEERKARDLAEQTRAIRQGVAEVRKNFQPTATYNA
jgi:predicted RNase H-like nuclease (RuvC/YqgF family)